MRGSDMTDSCKLTIFGRYSNICLPFPECLDVSVFVDLYRLGIAACPGHILVMCQLRRNGRNQIEFISAVRHGLIIQGQARLV